MIARDEKDRDGERFEHVEGPASHVAVHGVIVEQVARDQDEIDLAGPGQVADFLQGLEAGFANLFGDLGREAREAKPEMQVGRVQKRNHLNPASC